MLKGIKIKDGGGLDHWTYKSCYAQFATGKNWATLYLVQSSEEGKGHATTLLIEAKKHYETQNKFVAGSVPLNGRMAELYEKVGYKYYT